MTTQTTKTTHKGRGGRRARANAPLESSSPDQPSKLDRIVTLLIRTDGASLGDLTAATGWQPHSVRGALAGALKRKGHKIRSEKIDGVRRYRIGAPR